MIGFGYHQIYHQVKPDNSSRRLGKPYREVSAPFFGSWHATEFTAGDNHRARLVLELAGQRKNSVDVGHKLRAVCVQPQIQVDLSKPIILSTWSCANASLHHLVAKQIRICNID